MRRLLPFFLSICTVTACSKKIEGPTPSVETVVPGAVCQSQLNTSVKLTGSGFSPLVIRALQKSELVLPRVTLSPMQDIGGAPTSNPSVDLPDDSSDPTHSRVHWVSQNEMAFDVTPELQLGTGLFDVTVTNANGNAQTLAGGLLSVPPPTLTRLGSDLLCGDKSNELTLTGDFFIRSTNARPTVLFDTVEFAPSSMEGCRKLPGRSGLEACTGISVALPAKALAVGVHAVTVRNPSPVGCGSVEKVTLTILPEPMLTAVVPDVACAADGSVSLTLTGTGFLTVDGTTPSVAVGTLTLPSIASGCSPVTGPSETVQTCTSLEVTVPQGASPGTQSVGVTNPSPAGCTSAAGPQVILFPAPVIASVDPLSVCSAAGQTSVAVSGIGFVTVAGAAPSVKVGTQTYPAVASGCSPVTGTHQPVQICTTLTFTVLQGTFTPGSYPVTVTNPGPVGCVSTGTSTLIVTAPPTLTSVAPSSVCSGGASITLTGTHFEAGASVTLGAIAAQRVTVAADGNSAVAMFPPGLTAGASYFVTLTNPTGCTVTSASKVTVVPGPQIFYVDPSTVYNGISVQATVYGTGFTGAVQSVTVTPAGGGTAITLAFTYDALRPNQVQVVVPKGIAPGTYDMDLHDTTACNAHLLGALKVVGQTTLTLQAISPPFGWTNSSTAVTVTDNTTTSAGFLPVPRLYLNPTVPGPSTVATSLGAVSFESATSVTALVRSGLPVGFYELIAVNPDGTVGFLASAFQVTSAAPPTVSSVSPGSLPTGSLQTFTVSGKDFRTPTVTLNCVDSSGATATGPLVTVTGSSATSISASVTGSSGVAACIVRVTDGDGTYADFSALVFTNPAQNLSATRPGPDLAVGRRGPVALGGDATTAARFLHVLGGDDGATPPTSLDTVESSSLSLLGVPSPFFTQRNRLKTARALAGGAQIGRWLYLAGGSSGGNALDTIERAFVLDPAQREEVTDLLLDVDTSAPVPKGLAPGLWYYRVAAVMGSGDLLNPSGENLASDPFPVQLPDLGSTHFDVTIQWKTDPSAVKYRIYRSPAAGATVGTEEEIAEVSAPTVSFKDFGGTSISTQNPLRVGSLGVWQTLGAKLSLPREGAGVSWGSDPAAPGTAYLYVIGGRQNATTVSKTYDFLTIIGNPDQSQTVAANVMTGSAALTTARWQLSASRATNQLSSRIGAGQTYIYALSGVAADGSTLVTETSASLVQSGGQLGAWTSLSTVGRAGYASTVAGNFVYAFGGKNAAPDATVISGEICGPGLNACGSAANQVPPKVANWNSTGSQMSTARYLMGGTLTGAFIYLAGGESVALPLTVTKTTEYYLW